MFAATYSHRTHAIPRWLLLPLLCGPESSIQSVLKTSPKWRSGSQICTLQNPHHHRFQNWNGICQFFIFGISCVLSQIPQQSLTVLNTVFSQFLSTWNGNRQARRLNLIWGCQRVLLQLFGSLGFTLYNVYFTLFI